MDLLKIDEQGMMTLTPEMLIIKEFKKLWTRNETRSKSMEDLSVVRLFADYKSPYNSYPEDERMDIIVQDVITQKNWKVDEKLLAAIAKYKSLQQTFSMRFLQAARAAGFEIMRFLENVNLDSTDAKGSVLYKPADITKALKESGAVLEAIDKWEEKVKTELNLQSTAIRGGGEVGIFEDEAVWLKK